MKIFNRQNLVFALLIFTAGAAYAQQSPPRTVTNADLEKYRVQRVRSDEDYQKNYRQRGLPSPEEIERRNDDNIRRVSEYSTELRAQRELNEASYQEQANAITNQIAGVDAQIAYLTASAPGGAYRGGQVWLGYSTGGYYRGGHAGNYTGRARAQNGAVIGPNTAAVRQQASMFPNAATIRADGLGLPFRRRGGNGPIFGNGYFAPGVTGGNYTQNEMGARLSYLYQMRAALTAQRQTLAEKARRAGMGIY